MVALFLGQTKGRKSKEKRREEGERKMDKGLIVHPHCKTALAVTSVRQTNLLPPNSLEGLSYSP